MTAAWHKRAGQALGRQFPLMGISVAHLLLWTAAALLVTETAVLGTDGPVLLRGLDGCGWPISTSNSQSDFLTQSLLQESASYATQCYPKMEDNVSGSSPCDSRRPFVHTSINFTVEEGIDCPFPDTSICRDPHGGFRLTSELINSQIHLGVNTAVEDQIAYRREMTCAPIQDQPDGDLVTETNATTVGNTVIRQRSFHYLSDPADTNNTDPFVVTSSNSALQQPFSFTAHTVYSNLTDTDKKGPNRFSAVDALMPIQADLDIAVMTSNLKYTTSFSDPLFGTEERDGKQLSRGFSAFACATTHQFCNPVNGLCTRKGKARPRFFKPRCNVE
jgi:hypothetical protein